MLGSEESYMVRLGSGFKETCITSAPGCGGWKRTYHALQMIDRLDCVR